MGLEAVTLTLRELIPQLGRPVAVQRELDYALAPGLEWTIQGFLDLETLRPATTAAASSCPAIVDYKVKNTLHSQAKADHDPQAGLYLAGRWLAGQPAEHFCFAQIGKPGTQAQDDDARAFVVTRRTRRRSCAPRWRGSRRPPARSHALYERYGPDEPWGFADPAAGSARRATARTTRAAPAAADCERRRADEWPVARAARTLASVAPARVGDADARSDHPRGKEAS